jgi:hypothetical protein
VHALKQQVDATPVRRLFVIGLCLLTGLKLLLAAQLDLYSDEVFYWQESTRPALAYSDLPFVTSLLAGLGASFAPGNTLAVRSLFLLLGSALPLLVYWLALPHTNRQQATESAAITLCLPLAGFLGLLAVPDVPLLFFGLLSIGLFDRALRKNGWGLWTGLGLVVALGLATHYRFVLYPLAAVLYLAFSRQARPVWRNPRLWFAMLIASCGLLPILWFNLSYQLASASFYLIERHPWQFQSSGLLHIFKQAGLVTPLLYGVFVVTLLQLLRRARSGDGNAALFLSFALTNLLVYLVLAPWTDSRSTSIHWPLSGYLPLLVFVPQTLRELHAKFAARWRRVTASRMILAVPALGFAGTLIALLGVGSQAFQSILQPVLGPDVLSTKMAGWKPFATYTAERVHALFPQQTPTLVTDNYYLAAQIEFAGIARPAYTFDEAKAVNDGRRTQLAIWQQDEAGLRKLRNTNLLFITEDTTLDIDDKSAMLERFCRLATQVEHAGTLSLFGGDKHYSFYRAQSRPDEPSTDTAAYFPCPFPAQAWIDTPPEQARLQGRVPVTGWAFNEDVGIQAVFLVIDDERLAQMPYGDARPDVVSAMGVQSDPGAPALGFHYELDTTTLTPGRHTLTVDLVNRAGTVTRYRTREIVTELP